MEQKFRWGILGTGSIARKFAAGVAVLEDQEVVAVGSRTQAAADRFANEFDIVRRHASYAELAADRTVDALYIATPHSLHKECTLLGLEQGKHVLCEKPFAINARETAAMITVARQRRLFLMEAMWSRFLPVLVETRRLITSGAIGEVQMVQADFGFRATFNPASRLFDPALGGGALLDVGVYPVSLAHMVLGTPNRIAALGELGPSGVDQQMGILFGFPGGALAVLSTTVTANTPHEALIMGTGGWIHIDRPWWISRSLTLQHAGEEPQVIDLPFIGNGYAHEASEVAACVRAGKLESDIMPLDETLAVMQSLDAIRAQVGLAYPNE